MTIHSARRALRHYRILVVDDDEVLQRLYRDALQHHPTGQWTLHQVASGAAGLAAFRAQEFDCVLLDLRLPDMTGLQFLAEIAVDGVLPCSVVLITGQGSEALAVEAMKRGVQDYLVKGEIELSGLRRVIENAVSQTELRRKLADSAAAMGRSEARFRRLFEAAPAAMVMTDQAGKIVLTNALTEKLFGYTSGELLGKRLSTLLPEALPARPLMGHAAASGAMHGRKKDGADVEVEVAVNSIETEDGVAQLSAIVDVSARVRLESELRQAQKLQILGRLAAGVSHDFNNILQVIFGGVDVLKDEQTLSAAGQSFVELIEGAARRGQYLTHHLLSYSRKQLLVPKLLDTGALLQNLSGVLARTLASNITVTTQLTPPLGMIRTDRGQLETALMNLAINAAHAMPQGGTLTIAATSRPGPGPFPKLPPGRYAVISVTDTGTGMTKEICDCIFEPFFTTKGLEGTGLGLAMVQGFSRQAGGDVHFTSTVGQGTCFEIWLPEVADESVADAPGALSPARPQAGRVLLVDDTNQVLIAVEGFLRKAGFRVQCAGGGSEALAAFAAREHFDIIVVDYMMPGANGADVIRQARKLQPDLPGLIITGYADTDEQISDLANTALLRKPFEADELIRQISALIGGAVTGGAGSAALTAQ